MVGVVVSVVVGFVVVVSVSVVVSVVVSVGGLQRMTTIYQMTLQQVREKCEKESRDKHSYRAALENVVNILAQPYDDVVEKLLERYGATDSV